MNEIEYILRIVLKARDELATALKRAREELRLFANAAETNQKKIDAFNTSIEKMDKNVANVTNKFREWRAVLQGTSDDTDGAKKSFGDLGKEVDRTNRTAQSAARSYTQLREQARQLNREARELAETEHKTNRERDYAISQLKQYSRELEGVSRKMRTGTDDSIRAFNASQRAAAAADKLIAAKKREADEFAKAERLKLNAIERNNALIANEIEQQIKREEDAEKRRVNMVKLGNAAIAREIEQQIKREEAASKRRIKNMEDERREFQRSLQLQREARAASERAGAVRGRLGSGDRLGAVDVAEARNTVRELNRVSREYEKVARATGHGAREARLFAGEAEKLSVQLRKTERDADRTSGVLGQLAHAFGNNHESIAALDNQLRGIGLLLVVGFAQQLITVLTGLGGAFVAVASSAAQAGAAIGGAFVAGVGQALPAIGLLSAALFRVQSVMDAVKQAQTAQQQAAVQGATAGRRVADATDTLRNANEGLETAQQRVRESQEGLTQARRDARRDLQDLIIAEKNADLAARGAALSQQEAQEQLRQAMQTGDVEEIHRAELQVLQSRVDLEEKLIDRRRARADLEKAQKGGVEGMEGVQQAKQQLEDASRAAERAGRGIETAKRNAAEAAAGTQTAAATLQFLLAQLSPAERRLYEAVTKFQELFRSGPMRDVTDILVNSFARSVEKITKIIQMPEVLGLARKTSSALAKQMNRVFDGFTTEPMIKQFIRIGEEGAKNLRPVGTIALRVGRSLANIAEAAGPALRRMLQFISGLAAQFEKLTGNRRKMTEFFTEGEKHFEQWIKLGLAVIKLFLALAGAGGARTGLNLVKDATKAIDDLTKKVEDNREKVSKFFEDSRGIVHEVVGVLVELAKALFRSFTPERVHNFATLLKRIVIPALEDIIGFLGDVTNKLVEFADTPVGEKLLKGLVVFVIMNRVVGAVIGSFKVLTGVLGPVAKVLGEIAAKQIAEKGLLRLLLTGARFAAFGAGFIAIAAAVVFLLDKFGLLDDVWDELKEAFGALVGQIGPPLSRLIDSFEYFFQAIEDGKGPLGLIIDLLRPLLKILIEVGGFLLEGIAKAIGQVIGGVLDVIGGLMDIIMGALTGDFDKVWEGVKDLFRGLANILIGGLQLLLFRGLGSLFRLAGRGIWAGLRALGGLIVDFLKALPRNFLEAAVAIVRFFWRGFRGLGRIIRNVVEDAWQWLKGLPGRFWELAKDIAQRFWNGYRRMGRIIRNAIEDAWEWVKKLPGRFWELAKDIAVRFWNGYRRIGYWIRKGIEDVWDWIKGLPKRFGDIAKDAVKLFVDAFKNIGGKVVDMISEGAGGAARFAKKMANGLFKLLEDGWNKTLGGKGVGPFKIPELHLPRLAGGGPVPGSGSGDSILALLEPGEHVWTKREVAAAGGHGAMYAMRRALGGGGQSTGGGYQGGGRAEEGVRSGSLTITFKGGDLDNFLSRWRDFWIAMAVSARRGVTAVITQFRNMRQETARLMTLLYRDTDRTTDRLWRDIKRTLDNIVDAFQDSGRKIVRSWGKTWDDLMDITHKGLFYIGHETNKSLTAFGAKHIDFGFTEPQKNGKAAGGWINNKGHRGRDRGLYPLGDGEAVLNWQHQKYVEPAMYAYYGHGLTDMFNRTHGYHAGGPGQGFAGGGLTGPQGSGAAFTAIANFAKKKFGLTMTAGRTDHNYTTSSGNVSDHSWGGAGDFSNGVLTPQEDAFSNFWLRKAPQVIKQLIWRGKDQQRGFPIEDHTDHVHLAIQRALAFNLPRMARIISRASRGLDISDLLAGVQSGGEFTVDHVDAPDVGGKGPMGALLKRLLKKVTTAANNWIDKKAGELGPGTTGGSVPNFTGPWVDVMNKIAKAKGWSVKDWKDLIQGESGGDPTARNPSSGAFGIGQFLGSTLTAYAKYGATSSDPSRQIHAMAQYISDRYGTPTNAYHTWLSRSPHWYAEGGIVPGGEGMPVPIVAHAKEWILNPGQQQRIANLVGTSPGALASMLGFYGSKGSFQGGTSDVTEGAPGGAALNRQYTTEAMRERIQRLRRGIYELPILPLYTWHQVMREVRRAYRAITRSGRAYSYQVKQINDEIEKLQKGDETKEEKKKIEELRNKRKQILLKTPLGDKIKEINDKLEALKKGDEDDEELRKIRRLEVRRRQLMRGARRAIAAESRLKALEALTKEGGLIEQLDAARERFTSRLARGMLFATYRFHQAGRRVTLRRGMNTEVERATQELENSRKEIGKIMGEEGVITKALKQTNRRLRQLRRGGVTEEEAPELRELVTMRQRLREQRVNIRDLHAQALERIYQAQAARQQAIVDEINQRYERQGQRLDFRRRIATAIGREDLINKVNDAQRALLTSQANELERRIAYARRAGQGDLARQLQLQVRDLRVQIFELVQQQLRDAMDVINNAAQRRLGRLDVGGRLLDALGRVGLGSAAYLATTGETFTRAGIFGQRGAALQSQYSQLAALRGRAGAAGNVGLVNELTDQLADLEVAIKENTKAYFDARVEDVNNRAQFGLNVNDLNKQITELEGTIAGQIDQQKIVALLQERGNILTTQRTALEALLLEAQRTGNQQAVNDLTVALLENRLAILQNTQSIDEQTGLMKEPQTFTSSAWQWFREAIFGGMGQVLPQYNPQNMMGSLVTGAVIQPASATSNRISGDTNINLYEAGRPPSLTEIGSAVVFASKTTQ